MLTGVSVHNDVCPVHEAIWQSLEDCTKTLSGESKSWDGDDCIEGQINIYIERVLWMMIFLMSDLYSFRLNSFDIPVYI